MTFETAALALGATNERYHKSIPLGAFVSTESVLRAIDKRIAKEMEGKR